MGLSTTSDEVGQRLEQYQTYVHEHPFPDLVAHSSEATSEETDEAEQGCETDKPSESTAVSDLDPLTAIMMEEQERTTRLQELDLKYRKERARRKRAGGSSSNTANIEDEAYDENAATLEIIDKDLHRLHVDHETEALRTVLYVYHCRHPDPGYRQGMHEVASNLLLVLEEPSEVYAFLDVLLHDIAVAYDVQSTHHPLEQMSRRILSMTARVDSQLWERLESVGVPPAIYLTKWIRLLFGREVTHVLELWDIFFELRSLGYSMLGVLEATSAARLLHHRREILLGEDPLHFLMNIPTENDIAPIVELLHPLLKGQTISMPPIPIPIPVSSPSSATRSAPSSSSSPTTALHRSSLLGLPSTAPAAATVSQAAPSLTAAFSSMKQQFTEALDKTQTISKRIYHEWENLSTDRALEDPLRSYDDTIWHSTGTTATIPSVALSSGSLPPVDGITPLPSSASGVTAAAAVSHHPQRLYQEMELHLAVLQNFCMNCQRQHRNVPSNVWESLAELESLRKGLLLLDLTQTTAVPPPLP